MKLFFKQFANKKSKCKSSLISFPVRPRTSNPFLRDNLSLIWFRVKGWPIAWREAHVRSLCCSLSLSLPVLHAHAICHAKSQSTSESHASYYHSAGCTLHINRSHVRNLASMSIRMPALMWLHVRAYSHIA